MVYKDMLIVPCGYDEHGVPNMYDSGRVFSHGQFVGVYRAESVGKVCALAYINAKVSGLKAEVCNKMRIPSEQWMMA